MKTFKELQESITKALIKFGSKGLRKIPNPANTLNLKQLARTNYLNTKYQNLFRLIIHTNQIIFVY